MKYFKRSLILIFCLMVMLPTCVFAAKKKDLVNVYVFEAGGCGACSAELEFLKGLDTYNKEFRIVEKELYESVSTWAEGKDYKLGVSVANLFYNQGFTDAGYTATPFVVVSDLYAATGANRSNEFAKVIEQAYDEGDKDVVACVEDGKDDCLSKDAEPVIAPTATTSTTTAANAGNQDGSPSNGLVLLVLVGIVVIIILLARKNNTVYYDDDDEDDDSDEDSDDDDEEEDEDDDDESEDEDDEDDSDEDEEVEEEESEDEEEEKDTKPAQKEKEVKKVNSTPNKKTTTKKSTNKKNTKK